MTQRIVTFGEQTASKLARLVNTGKASIAPNVYTNIPETAPTIFRNDSGEAIPAYGCMKIIDAETDSATGRYVVVVDKPDSTSGPFLFNGDREIAIDGYGAARTGIVRALTSGAVSAGVWGPLSDWAVVVNGIPAVEIFGELDTNLAIGSTQISNYFKLGKSDSTITAGSSGTVSIWSGSTLADTGVNVTAWLDWMDGGENVSSGKELLIQWFPDRGKWQIIGADCE